MPIIKSAIKRVRQEAKRNARNNAAKRRIKVATKATLASISASDLKLAHDSLLKAISQIDKAIKKGTLHKNTGARRKSSLVKAYNSSAEKPFGTDKVAAKKPATSKTAKKAVAKKPAAKK